MHPARDREKSQVSFFCCKKMKHITTVDQVGDEGVQDGTRVKPGNESWNRGGTRKSGGKDWKFGTCESSSKVPVEMYRFILQSISAKRVSFSKLSSFSKRCVGAGIVDDLMNSANNQLNQNYTKLWYKTFVIFHPKKKKKKKTLSGVSFPFNPILPLPFFSSHKVVDNTEFQMHAQILFEIVPCLNKHWLTCLNIVEVVAVKIEQPKYNLKD